MTPARGFRGPSDLHLHSDRSDGTQPPAGVVAAAAGAGLHTLALTDHDTTSGWPEAARAAMAAGVTFLPGMEMSAKHDGRSVHVLGYLFDPDDAALSEMTGRVRAARRDRAHAMVDRLAADVDLDWSDVVVRAPQGATVGRPHIADALIDKGVVRDRAEAFARLLHPAGPYYVALFAPDPVTAVALIAGAGGVPVLAHPASGRRHGVLPDDVLQRMLRAGLAGFELDHRENRPDGVRRLRRIVAAHDLIVTGSSDYHGAGKPNLPGEHTTADDMVQRIIDRGRGSAPAYA